MKHYTKQNITAIIIAGGKSSRMGSNKALITYNGKRLIDWAIHKVEPLVSTIIISSNTPLSGINYPIYADAFTDIGPLGGLHIGLAKSKTNWNLIIPCDMPNLDALVYYRLIEKTSNTLAVVPKHSNGNVEPLVALYHKSVHAYIETQIQKKDYKLVHLLNQIAVTYIDAGVEHLFKNINYPNDLT